MQTDAGSRSVMAPLLAAVLALVASCSSDQAVSPSTTSEPVDTTAELITGSTSTVAETLAVGSQVVKTGTESSDGAPVLTMSFFSWELYDWQQPLGLRSVFLYADGTGIELVGDAAGEGPPDAVRFSVDGDVLRDVLVVAERTRTSSRSDSMIPLPEGAQIQGGGRTVFVSQHGDEQSVIAVDQLGMVASSGDGERDALEELSLAIDQLVSSRASEQPVVFDRWAVLSVDLPGVQRDPVGSTWHGPDVDQADWVQLDDGAECVAVAASEFPPGFVGQTSAQAVLNQRTIVVRPLLPHEATCHDVGHWHRLTAR